jgi:prophage regulatory protein
MLTNERLITRDELLTKIPFTVQHIYRLEAAGKFPRRVRVGANRVAWVESEILDWMAQRIQERGSCP